MSHLSLSHCHLNFLPSFSPIPFLLHLSSHPCAENPNNFNFPQLSTHSIPPPPPDSKHCIPEKPLLSLPQNFSLKLTIAAKVSSEFLLFPYSQVLICRGFDGGPPSRMSGNYTWPSLSSLRRKFSSRSGYEILCRVLAGLGSWLFRV